MLSYRIKLKVRNIKLEISDIPYECMVAVSSSLCGPIRVVLRVIYNAVQAISDRSRSKDDDNVVIGSFFNTGLSVGFSRQGQEYIEIFKVCSLTRILS